MQGTLTQSQFVVNFGNDTYACVDKAQEVVTVHQGQRTGSESDWGGQVIAFLTLEQAEAIAAILYAPFSQPDEAYKDVQPEEQRVEYIGS